ncbi:MAG: molybdenum cofactor cytidylyltransferase [Gammaproteobacteria bacterium]|jgi:molybdenum cofactor cytidylyltransferase
MKFGSTPVDEACGHILAHSQRLTSGTLKKGRLLDAQDIQHLRASGVKSVVSACLDEGDVGEDEAAETLAIALAGAAEGIRVAAPFTGRSNLFASRRALMSVDAQRINAMNRVHESLTVATLPSPMVVDPKQMLATVKVIAFSVPRAALNTALDIVAGEEPAIRVHRFLPLRVGLVQTRLDGTRESVLDKTVRVLEARIVALGGTLVSERRCQHEDLAVAQAVSAELAQGRDLVLLCGASAIVDRRDVIPAGIVASGGELLYFGMPVDPGNLLLLARHGDVPVLGLPGCARSPKYNGLDLVLERIAAGLDVSPGVITAMGVGGLLKEIAERPQPRLGQSSPAQAPRVSALVLAGGQSRRMGDINKLLAPVDGVPMVLATVRRIIAAGVDEVIVVTGHEAQRVRDTLTGESVRVVHNPYYDQGLSTSMNAGLAALGVDVDAALVCLGDMPRVTPRHVHRLLAAFDPTEGRSICVPTFNGKRGNPVLWDRRYFEQMREVRGDVGARHLIGAHDDSVCEVAMDDAGVLLDVDSPAALAALDAS